jgi:Tfp pilus assembly protein PilF
MRSEVRAAVMSSQCLFSAPITLLSLALTFTTAACVHRPSTLRDSRWFIWPIDNCTEINIGLTSSLITIHKNERAQLRFRGAITAASSATTAQGFRARLTDQRGDLQQLKQCATKSIAGTRSTQCKVLYSLTCSWLV